MTTLETLNKRAKSKFLQDPLLEALVNLNSKFQPKYLDAVHCGSLIVHEGNKLTSRYCKHRFCRVCNRIRTGKLIQGYGPALEAMPEQTFLTLTIPNVPGEKLRQTVKGMIATIRRIQERRRRKLKLPGINAIRKLECTYNAEKDNYHPHFHFIVSTPAEAMYLGYAWLEAYPEADMKGQDLREAYNPLELFKYFTKLTSKTGEITYSTNRKVKISEEAQFPEAIDTIFQAIENIRIIQPMGKVKMVSDDIEELQADEADETVTQEGRKNKFYLWSGENWFSPYTGELLTSFRPSEKMRIFRARIRYREKIPIT